MTKPDPLIELRSLNQWVVWRYERRDSSRTKVLYNPRSGYRASATDLKTWGRNSEAIVARMCGLGDARFDGIGFVFSKEDGLFGIDLDKCVVDGQIEQWAQEIIDSFPTYWEFSTSGTGLHGIGYGSIPDEFRTGKGTGRRKDRIEVYDNGRYFAEGSSAVVASAPSDCQAQLTAFMQQHFSPGPETTHTVDAKMADVTAIEQQALMTRLTEDRAVSRIWDRPPTTNQSSNEFLLAKTAFERFPDLSDAEGMALVSAYRVKSGEKPGKANRYDYLARTIAHARSSVNLSGFDVVRENDADPFALMTIADGLRLPPPEMLIEGLLPKQGVGFIAGPPACFKSFIAITLGMHVAHGLPLGTRKVERAPVWYLANEGQNGLPYRAQAWLQHHGLGETDQFLYARATPDLIRPDSIASAIKSFRPTGAQPGTIILDTFVRASIGIDANNASEVAAAMQQAERLGKEFDCFVLLVDHVGKSAKKGIYGSYVKSGNADFVGLVTRSGNSACLHLDKLKDGEDGYKLGFQMEKQVVKPHNGGTSRESLVALFDEHQKAVTYEAYLLHILQMHGAKTREELKEAFVKQFPSKEKSFDTPLSRLKQKEEIVETDGILAVPSE